MFVYYSLLAILFEKHMSKSRLMQVKAWITSEQNLTHREFHPVLAVKDTEEINGKL